MRFRAALLAGCVLALAAAAPTEAYVVAGRAWPTTTITYHANTAGYRTAVDRAARIYNHAGIGVRLRRAASAAEAEVVFVYGGRRCEGSSYVGFQRWRTARSTWAVAARRD